MGLDLGTDSRLKLRARQVLRSMWWSKPKNRRAFPGEGEQEKRVRKNAREIKKERPEREEEQACNRKPQWGCARGGFGDLE